MFELLPYGAIANVVCTSSSRTGNMVNSYSSSSNYTTSNQQIGVDGSYFLFSQKEAVQMTYNYTKKNGILIEIVTNLRVVTNSNIRDNGNGHYEIINQQWLSSGNGSFTISNDTWFNGNRTEEPYIKLCFNKVQIECCFTNPWHGNGPSYCDNGWMTLANDAASNRLKPVSEEAQNYCILNRYITASWNQRESNKLFYEEYLNNGEHWYQIWFAYGNKNKQIVDFDGTITRTISGTTSTSTIQQHTFLQQRLWSNTDDPEQYTVTIPKLNGEDTVKINDTNFTPYSYFKIGYTINFQGESAWQPASTLSINENTYNYDSRGFIYTETINSSINSIDSSPMLYSHPSSNNWNSNSIFYKTGNNKYVSPSDGLQITSRWSTGSYCVPYDSCPDDGCYGYSECPQDGICPQDGEYQPWIGIILYNNTNIVDSSGNLVRYGSQGEEVTVIGEYTMPGTGQLYYQIGANQYINYHSIERKSDGCTSDCPTDQGGCSDYWCNYQCYNYDCSNFVYCGTYEEYSCPNEGCEHCWSEGGCPSLTFN